MPKGLFLWQSEAGKYLKFRGPLNFIPERLKVEFFRKMHAQLLLPRE
jgi:hypothetical protein